MRCRLNRRIAALAFLTIATMVGGFVPASSIEPLTDAASVPSHSIRPVAGSPRTSPPRHAAPASARGRAANAPRHGTGPLSRAQLQAAFGLLPLGFEINQGQAGS